VSLAVYPALASGLQVGKGWPILGTGITIAISPVIVVSANAGDIVVNKREGPLDTSEFVALIPILSAKVIIIAHRRADENFITNFFILKYPLQIHRVM
jgi:hypothetical protein